MMLVITYITFVPLIHSSLSFFEIRHLLYSASEILQQKKVSFIKCGYDKI